MRPLWNIVLALAAVLLVFFLVAPWGYGTPKEVAKGFACLSNLKQQARALIFYSEECDGRFPARDAWMDAIRPYAKDEPFHDPVFFQNGKPHGYGYAFDAALSCAKVPKPPETTPLTYDSANPIRNASDLVTSLPKPGRHRDRNNVGYADGHARAVKTP